MMFQRFTFSILTLLLLGSIVACSREETGKSPNILLIISDDQGWTDYGFMGHPHIQTPHIDRLSSEALTYTRGYVSAPLCRPSLATLATGLYPHQHGITGNDPLFDFEGRRYSAEWLSARAEINDALVARFRSNGLLPEILKEYGYLSLQTGKWWEGHWSRGGFDDGMTHGDPGRGGRHGDEGLKIGRAGLDEIFDFIDQAQQKEKPFFVWYAPFMPHSPHTPPDSLEQKYLPGAPTPAVARYWAMCEWFDTTCGQLTDYLSDKGIEKETVVIYVCDNGWIQDPEMPNRYAPRSKRSPYDFGIRTPIMVKWPGEVRPLIDTVHVVSSIDIVPTILSVCGVDIPESLPGIDLLNEGLVKSRPAVFAEVFDHDIPDIDQCTEGLQYRVQIRYPWKLILPDTSHLSGAPIELYNIEEDPFETNNLADDKPEILNQMVRTTNDWWEPVH